MNKVKSYKSLTKRESEVLELMSNGYTPRKIANLLFIDYETVRTHIKKLYFKLEVSNRDDAIVAARNRNYI